MPERERERDAFFFWTSAGSWKGSGCSAPLRGYVLLIALKCSVQRAARAARATGRQGLPVWLITKKLAVVVDFMLNYLSDEDVDAEDALPQPQPRQRDWRLPACLLPSCCPSLARSLASSPVATVAADLWLPFEFL